VRTGRPTHNGADDVVEYAWVGAHWYWFSMVLIWFTQILHGFIRRFHADFFRASLYCKSKVHFL
jgi:hypothetical protein